MRLTALMTLPCALKACWRMLSSTDQERLLQHGKDVKRESASASTKERDRRRRCQQAQGGSATYPTKSLAGMMAVLRGW